MRRPRCSPASASHDHSASQVPVWGVRPIARHLAKRSRLRSPKCDTRSQSAVGRIATTTSASRHGRKSKKVTALGCRCCRFGRVASYLA
jgi:hypothetical protein